jgi:polar amino acid transport system permease protein
MTELDIIRTWTPYLLAGLGWNFLISVIASALGTSLGGLCVLMMGSPLKLLRDAGPIIPTLLRGAPSLFLMFYFSIIIPNELELLDGSVIIAIPNWLKAALALTASPLAFTAWNLTNSLEFWRSGEKRLAFLFIPNWFNSFLFTFLASSGASLVGVSELVGRTNTVIKATGGSNAILLYSYAALIFVAASLSLSLLVRLIKFLINKKFAVNSP